MTIIYTRININNLLGNNRISNAKNAFHLIAMNKLYYTVYIYLNKKSIFAWN